MDLDTLSAELLAVVAHMMRSTVTSLWLRPSASGRLSGELACGLAGPLAASVTER